MLTKEQIEVREKALIITVEAKLPEFAKSCKIMDADFVALHQDAFAADYQQEEYELLGLAIKFAGLYGKEVRITGRNRATL